jgi:hypothetical protein
VVPYNQFLNPVLLTPNIKKSNLMERRLQMQKKKSNLIMIKNATIYEKSIISINRKGSNCRIKEQSHDSFEVDFDSAEFDDLNLDEGHRPAYDHEFFHNQNNIKRTVRCRSHFQLPSNANLFD